MGMKFSALLLFISTLQVAGSYEASRGTRFPKAEGFDARQMFHVYAEWHTERLGQLERQTGASRPGVVLCQPMFGLGNRIRGIMTCFTLAWATDRLLFIDWHHKYTVWNKGEIKDMPGGQPASLQDLFEAPGFDWSLEALESIFTPDDIAAEASRAGPDTRAVIERRDRNYLCDDLKKAWASEPIVMVKSYVWWNFVLKNEHHARAAQDALGVDDAGVLRVFQRWGPLLFRPRQVVKEMIAAIDDAMIPGAYRVGIHVRIGGNWYDKLGRADARPPLLAERAAGCALSTLPRSQRSRPVSYLVISDRAEGKDAVIRALGRSESAGRGVAAVRFMGDAKVQDALGIVNETHRRWLSTLGVVGWDIGEGSRVIEVGANNVSRNTTLDIQQALAEMFALGAVDSLVRTTDSSFSIIAHSFYPKETWYVEDEGEHHCHRQQTGEPQAWGTLSGVADTAMRHGGECVVQKALFDWSWVRTTA